MEGYTFDTLARTAGALPRRQSLLLLGGTGLAAALAGGPTARADKKAKKTCKKQKKQCRNLIQAFCAGTGEEALCLDALLPCCASCKLKAGVSCLLDEFSTA